VNDPLIAGQPEFSKAWMQRVSKKSVVSAWELHACILAGSLVHASMHVPDWRVMRHPVL
jgi:succinate dehydrogenase/fumarate reductase-like Fe-S protein